MKKISYKDICRIMPYKPPFLFIDKVVKIEKNKIITEKKFRKDEAFFKGHFKDFPIVPGVLIVEAVGQAGSLYIREKSENKDIDVLAFIIKTVKFLQPSFPDDILQFEVTLRDITPFWWSNKKPRIWSAKGKAFCKGELRAIGCFNLAVLDKERFRKHCKKRNSKKF